jgi:hypothetical protein
MNKFSKELIESMTDACEHAEGTQQPVRVHVVEVADLGAIHLPRTSYLPGLFCAASYH